MFSLHPQLAADTTIIGDLPLSRVLLMNNAELPWLILVPRRDTINEWYALTSEDQYQLHKESMGISFELMTLFNGDKLNTGALGNLVPQLHVHHIVRFKNDSVWPQPVWGNIQVRPYSSDKKEIIINKIRDTFSSKLDGFTPC